MRHSRGTGTPSTQSGSSSSGRGLVRGSHRDRGPVVMVPGDKGPSKNRTKVIIILGIALPVLACIIGIIAWSVTTDVLRISPRSHDNTFNRYGHRGKTRIDTIQARSDEDVDIFQFHDITAPPQTTTTVASVLLKVITQKAQPKLTSTPTRSTNTLVEPTTTESPKVSDILSRLISDMPIPKNPKNFVIFAPVAAEEPTKMRRFAGQVLVNEGEDLVAEESSPSVDVSQDTFIKVPFTRRLKSSKDESFDSKTVGMVSSDSKQDLQVKREDHSVWEGSAIKSDPLANHKTVHTQLTNKHVKINKNEFLKTNPNVPQSSKQDISRTVHHNLNDKQKQMNNQLSSNNSPTNQRPLRNEDQRGFQNTVQQPATIQNFAVLNQMAPSAQALISSPQLKQSPTLSVNNPPQQIPNVLQQIPNVPQQTFNSPQHRPNLPQQVYNPVPQSSPKKIRKPPHHYHHAMPDERPKLPPPIASSSSIQSNIPPSLHQTSPVIQLHSPQSQGPSRNSFNSQQDYVGGSYPVDNGYQSNNNGPQYFAPPPQTFHTKTSYERPSNKFGSSPSLSTYEKSAQSAVDQSKDGLHHHHHHHHHHEPIASNSDPIGDVNLSDVPRTNDADRLGTIGVGLGGPGRRGITVQIGGGGGGGGGAGLSGLLPLGALGIVKNIANALIPRPAFGLNSKVYLGVEVGRGGGGGGIGSLLG